MLSSTAALLPKSGFVSVKVSSCDFFLHAFLFEISYFG